MKAYPGNQFKTDCAKLTFLDKLTGHLRKITSESDFFLTEFSKMELAASSTKFYQTSSFVLIIILAYCQ